MGRQLATRKGQLTRQIANQESLLRRLRSYVRDDQMRLLVAAEQRVLDRLQAERAALDVDDDLEARLAQSVLLTQDRRDGHARQ